MNWVESCARHEMGSPEVVWAIFTIRGAAGVPRLTRSGAAGTSGEVFLLRPLPLRRDTLTSSSSDMASDTLGWDADALPGNSSAWICGAPQVRCESRNTFSISALRCGSWSDRLLTGLILDA